MEEEKWRETDKWRRRNKFLVSTCLSPNCIGGWWVCLCMCVCVCGWGGYGSWAKKWREDKWEKRQSFSNCEGVWSYKMRMCSQVSPRGGKHRAHRSRRLDENVRIRLYKKGTFSRLVKLEFLSYFPCFCDWEWKRVTGRPPNLRSPHINLRRQTLRLQLYALCRTTDLGRFTWACTPAFLSSCSAPLPCHKSSW